MAVKLVVIVSTTTVVYWVTVCLVVIDDSDSPLIFGHDDVYALGMNVKEHVRGLFSEHCAVARLSKRGNKHRAKGLSFILIGFTYNSAKPS